MALTTEQLLRMTVDEMNSGLRSYRPEYRYTREDAANYANLWNATKVSTQATVISDEYPQVILVDV